MGSWSTASRSTTGHQRAPGRARVEADPPSTTPCAGHPGRGWAAPRQPLRLRQPPPKLAARAPAASTVSSPPSPTSRPCPGRGSSLRRWGPRGGPRRGLLLALRRVELLLDRLGVRSCFAPWSAETRSNAASRTRRRSSSRPRASGARLATVRWSRTRSAASSPPSPPHALRRPRPRPGRPAGPRPCSARGGRPATAQAARLRALWGPGVSPGQAIAGSGSA